MPTPENERLTFAQQTTLYVLILIAMFLLWRGALVLSMTMPTWAITVGIFDLGLVAALSVWARKLSWIVVALSLTMLSTLAIGARSYVLAKLPSATLDAAARLNANPIQRVSDSLDRLVSAYPWIVLAILTFGACSAAGAVFLEYKAQRRK